MATGETTSGTDNIEMPSDWSVPGESQEESENETDSKENQVTGKTSTEAAGLSTKEKESKSDDFNEWCQNVMRDLDQKTDTKSLESLKKQVIQVEEMFESLKEGYEIESRLRETEEAIRKLKDRLNIPKENSKNVQTTISVSQESVLQRFKEMYEQWNKKWSGKDSESDLCKMHKECYEYCKDWFEFQMRKLLEVAKPQSENQSHVDNEKQIIQEAYKELARNTVGTDLEKLQAGGKKNIKANKETVYLRQDCLEICWITLILKVPMRFEFDNQNADERTFEGTTQDKTAIVIKPAVFLDDGTIKMAGMVRQKAG